MTKNTEKKAPTRARAAASERTSRAQDSRANSPIHAEVVDLSQGPLPAIPARDGMSQRWIRVRKGSETDAQNMFRATSLGWTPRRPDTVAKSLQFMMTQREGLGGCIGTHDMVLMERPVELSKRHEAKLRQDRKAREEAVRQNLFSEFKGAAQNGFEPVSDESKSRVERGRNPTIQDD